MSEEKSIEEVVKTELKEGEIDLSGNGRVSKVILKEGEGDETPQGMLFLTVFFFLNENVK